MANTKKQRHSRPFPGDLCDCREFVFRNNQLVCKRCGKPMKSEKKPISNKGLRFFDR